MTLVIILLFAISILLVVDSFQTTREQREHFARIESLSKSVSVHAEAITNLIQGLEVLVEDLEGRENKNDADSR